MSLPVFSCEEKRRILLHVVDKAFDDTSTMSDDEKWMELGREMNRDWQEIRDAYNQWRIEDNKPDVKKIEDDEHVHCGLAEVNDEAVGLIEVRTVENVQYSDEIQYADLNGQLYNVAEFEHQLMNNPQILDDMSYVDQQTYVVGGKRPLDFTDFNSHILEKYKEQSIEDLNLRREEHNAKMKIYKMHLEQGREIHKERMKLLKAKLRKLQDEVHHIDHVICNRHLKRKFKSGPI